MAVVGAGWIGSEFAASARQRGPRRDADRPAGAPERARSSAPRSAASTATSTLTTASSWCSETGSRRSRVTARSCACAPPTAGAIECDFAVVGIGVVPASSSPRRAGLNVDNGILVDEALRDLGAERLRGRRRRQRMAPLLRASSIRVEHWANALNQGPAAARSMLGDRSSYDRIPYFFSDQYDVGMEYSGYATELGRGRLPRRPGRRRVRRVLAARRSRVAPA